MSRHNDFDDEDNMLKDGQVLRVSMIARDSRLSPLQRSVAASTADRARVTDGTGDWRGLHRPGFRVQVDDRGRSLLDEAYAAYDTDVTNAWRHDAQPRGSWFESTGFGSHGPIGQQVGDVCMTDDRSEGRLRMVKGQFVCVAVKSQDENDRNDASDSRTLEQHRQTMDRLYQERDAELANAWRTTK
jgi:hypothetical protein